MAYSKSLVLVKVSLFKKDSVIRDKYDVYVSNDLKLINSLYSYSKKEYIENVELITEEKGKEYLNVNKPFWGIKFISKIDHNMNDNDFIQDLVEGISSYSPCNITSLIKDVKHFYGKDEFDDRYGIEKRNYIAVFEEYSYFDSYAGDGDYWINYEKITTLDSLAEDIKEKKDHKINTY